MREYEIMVIYDLALTEAEGPDASEKHLTNLIEQNGGSVLIVDHWGRRRMAYRINKQLDGDYILARFEIEPDRINPIESALRLNERVMRWLVTRADELPPLTPSRPAAQQAEAPQEQPGAAPATPAATTPAEPDEPPAATAEPGTTPEEQTAEERAEGASPPAEDVVESAVGADIAEEEPEPDEES